MSSTMTLSGAALAERYRRHGRHLPALVAAVLAVLIGRTLADLAWTLVPAPAGAGWTPPPAEPSQKAPGDSGPNMNALIQAHLFGTYEPPTVTQTSAAKAPETALNLTLVGLLADLDEQFSRALIAAQGGDEKAYAVGDDVARGVTLQAIFPDRVILSRNGRLETLSLERGKPGAVTADVTSFEEDSQDDASAGASVQLAQIREEVLADPGKASNYIRVQPANVGGQLKGYRIYPGRDRAAFKAAGLRPGDLVTSVNGVQLDDPAKALQLLSDLSQAGQINLVLERGGQPQNISLNLQ